MGRFYQTASRQMRYLFLVWLITSCLPASPSSPASPAVLLLCLCYCHPSIDCVVRVPPFVLTSNRYEHISVTNASTCPNKANNLMTMLREGDKERGVRGGSSASCLYSCVCSGKFIFIAFIMLQQQQPPQSEVELKFQSQVNHAN